MWCATLQQHCKELVIQNYVMLRQISNDISAMTRISKTTLSGDGADIVT